MILYTIDDVITFVEDKPVDKWITGCQGTRENEEGKYCLLGHLGFRDGQTSSEETNYNISNVARVFAKTTLHRFLDQKYTVVELYHYNDFFSRDEEVRDGLLKELYRLRQEQLC